MTALGASFTKLSHFIARATGTLNEVVPVGMPAASPGSVRVHMVLFALPVASSPAWPKRAASASNSVMANTPTPAPLPTPLTPDQARRQLGFGLR